MDIRNSLNTPLKRAGAVILVVGVAVLAWGLVSILADLSLRNFGRALERLVETWWGSVIQDRWDYRKYPAAAWGTYLSLIGAYLWLLHQRTLGRLFEWIRTGMFTP
ncbi:hypothetical protein [Stenotrophomonas maltophilia]|uniref:hypothetical protein n=1 Tax=Stenotrophomonas maltophilia TaxID=40324 RepID=UPI0015DED107|nr:hypothetical protein [Stenotrophomonas maltophilia]